MISFLLTSCLKKIHSNFSVQLKNDCFNSQMHLLNSKQHLICYRGTVSDESLSIHLRLLKKYLVKGNRYRKGANPQIIWNIFTIHA